MRRRRPDWLVSIAMGLGGSAAFALIPLWPGWWSAILAGLLFWPCAFIGGVVATHKEPR